MLPALVAIFDAPPRPDRPERAATGFEPVLLQALATPRESAPATETAAVEAVQPVEVEAPKTPAPEPAEPPAEETPAVETADVAEDVAAPVGQAIVDAPAKPVVVENPQPAPELPVAQAPVQQPETDEAAVAEDSPEQPEPELAEQTPVADKDIPVEADQPPAPQPKVQVVAQASSNVLVQAAALTIFGTGDGAPATRDSSKAATKDFSPLRENASIPAITDFRAAKFEATRVADAAPEQLGPRVVEQVQRALKTLTLRKGANEIEARIALSPPSLGALRLTVRVQDGELSGSVLTDNAAARHLLQTHLPELRDALAQQGLTLGHFNVSQDSANARDYSRNPARVAPQLGLTEASEIAAQPQLASVVAGRIVGFM